jgi:NAD(P)-dependent dehydrogenase (short-subunit alcohol dehydrogenase family)
MSKILENKTAIITGANQGLGFEIAKRFVKAGASIAICARDAQRLQDAAKELRLLASRRQQIIAVPVNVSMSDEV